MVRCHWKQQLAQFALGKSYYAQGGISKKTSLFQIHPGYSEVESSIHCHLQIDPRDNQTLFPLFHKYNGITHRCLLRLTPLLWYVHTY